VKSRNRDHNLISPRRGYMHHGIYVGEGKVVARFACGRSVWTRNSDLPGFVPQEVIRRARSRVGENRYQILRNNCEHFCE
jgi:hypothetical protein